MKPTNSLSCAFRGFIALSVISISFTFYEIIFRFDIKKHYFKFTNNNQSNETGLDIYDIVENYFTTEHSSGHDVNKAQTQHKCYHLNWNKSALTPDVFSKCGFITIGRRRGRMGNNMFQIAALFGIAYRLDMVPIIRSTFPLLEHYNLPNVIDINLINVHECNEKRGRSYYECYPGQTNFINITLLGLRQSWMYFDVIEGVIKKTFSQDFKRNSLTKAAHFIKSVSNSSFQHVGIHIRRTDIHINRVNRGGKTADVDYFNRAMSYFKIFYKRVHFVVLSDDIKWAKGNLAADDIFYSPFKSAADDMALMSICDHMIVSYGTFGWWGAWLANGTTVFFREIDKKRIKITPSDNSHYFVKGSIGIQ